VGATRKPRAEIEMQFPNALASNVGFTAFIATLLPFFSATASAKVLRLGAAPPTESAGWQVTLKFTADCAS